MSKKQTTFRIIEPPKKKTEIVIYDTIVLINKFTTKLEVTLLNGDYFGFKELDTNIIESLSEEDQERLVQLLKDF